MMSRLVPGLVLVLLLSSVGCGSGQSQVPPHHQLLLRSQSRVRIAREMKITLRCLKVLPIVRRASRLYLIEAHLILAIIKVESNFKPWAISRVGAMGLMQLMPRTARGNGVTRPHDVEQNIIGGTLVLRKFLEYYNGDVTYGLAAYNAGYVKTNRARRLGSLPFNYRSYVKKVLNARDHIARNGCRW